MKDKRTALEDKIGRLERRNWILTGAIAGLVLLGLGGAVDRNDPIKAGAFQLVDGSGNIRAELAIRDGSVGLFLRDQRGNDRLLATHDSGATSIFLKDEEGTTRIGIAQFAHGGGGVALHGPESKGAAVLYLKGEGSLRFFDAEGRVTNQVLSVAEDGAPVQR